MIVLLAAIRSMQDLISMSYGLLGWLTPDLRLRQKLSVRHVSNPSNSGQDNRRSGRDDEGAE